MTNFLSTLELYPPWLTATPKTGTIAAGQSQNVDVSYNATGLEAGDYVADLHLISNDPVIPELIVPSHLNVFGIPEILVTPDTIDYGFVFTGGSKESYLLVENIGTDVLNVSSITSDNFDFISNMNSFSLVPGEVMEMIVTFNPSSLGSINGELTIVSDDPDMPMAIVILQGDGLAPPEIEVSPDSIAKSLILTINPVATDTLMIYNKAGSDLVWNITLLSNDPTPLDMFILTSPPPYNSSLLSETPIETPAAPPITTNPYPVQASLNDLTGISIMIDESHGSFTSSSWQTIISDLQSRGATVIINTAPISSGLLANIDIFWLTDHSPTWSPVEVNALSIWVNAGGGLFLEGDNSNSSYNNLLSSIGSDILYSETNGTQGVTTNIATHETTVGVDSLYFANPMSSLTLPVTTSSSVIISDRLGIPNTAYSLTGLGVVIASSDELFYDGIIGAFDNQLFGNQLFDFLANNVDWVTVAPQSGITSAGDSSIVQVVIDGSNLSNGTYSYVIDIKSNDPIIPTLEVPVEIEILEFVCGDANSDGLVDQNDLAFARETYFNCVPVPNPYKAIDFNCNDRIDISDIMMLGRYLNGLGSLSCCYNSMLTAPTIRVDKIVGELK